MNNAKHFLYQSKIKITIWSIFILCSIPQLAFADQADAINRLLEQCSKTANKALQTKCQHRMQSFLQEVFEYGKLMGEIDAILAEEEYEKLMKEQNQLLKKHEQLKAKQQALQNELIEIEKLEKTVQKHGEIEFDKK